MKKIQKKRLWIGVIIAVIGGIMLFGLYNKAQLEKQAELERNREYEVSLVNALKNSYEGIEEIRITDPNYTMPPGSWSCDVTLLFKDGQTISYRIGHNLNDNFNYSGSVTNEQYDFLEARKGNTDSTIKVVFSDETRGSI
ncbi:hypothetical protein ACTGZQ_00785 [Streptococcus suis]